MALPDATAFKAATTLAAVQLNAAMGDTVLTGIANEISGPSHPLRRLDKLFKLDPQSGQWTSNDDYIDKAYAGKMPSEGTRGQQSVTDPPTA